MERHNQPGKAQLSLAPRRKGTAGNQRQEKGFGREKREGPRIGLARDSLTHQEPWAYTAQTGLSLREKVQQTPEEGSKEVSAKKGRQIRGRLKTASVLKTAAGGVPSRKEEEGRCRQSGNKED